jgi:hypothetical protein
MVIYFFIGSAFFCLLCREKNGFVNAACPSDQACLAGPGQVRPKVPTGSPVEIVSEMQTCTIGTGAQPTSPVGPCFEQDAVFL